MKPYGRIKKLLYNYVDHHLPKLRNWWEGEPSTPKSNKSARQLAKKEIKKEVNDVRNQR